ncbi:glycosyltransferase family 1 protein [Haloferax sp. KTX1]|uniref:glycosyltransferase family 4 protein n=1 Tax=Haloferax sp. KTX1 TaxID=2600597 RepID=UPI0011DE18CC|nr:glycosyltransferase family 1 protein [Haloferax sp. KTX1]
MKIGINARTFSVDEPGGAVQASIRLTRELINNPEHEVVLFGSHTLESDFDVDIYSTRFHENQMFGLLWERTILPRLARKADVEVLYCPNGNGPLHELSIPVVMCIHDVNAQKGMSDGLHQLYRKLTVPVAARACDKVVTVSEFSKSEISSELGINQDDVTVIYNGVDDFYFEDSSSSFDLPDRYLLFVGSLNPRKNISGLLQSFNKIRDECDVELVLIGPSNKDIFKTLELDPVDGIHFCGYLDRREVKYAYENAEALVFPSFYEGFGLPPLEAFACGTPVVASNRGALPEILGDYAVFVDPDAISDISDGMMEVLDNEPPSDSILIEWAKEFTWPSVADRLLSVFEEQVK